MGKIDFDSINRASLSSLPGLLEIWLPGGRVVGNEYMCASVQGGEGDSFRVNVTNGKWAEFNGDDRGGDLVSLYAHINGLSQSEAARQMAETLGVVPCNECIRSGTVSGEWVPVTPVPDEAACPFFRHMQLGNPTYTWTYRDAGGSAVGYVCRYENDGEKTILPLAYCRSSEGKMAWQRKWFTAPRPLYGVELIGDEPGFPVLIVEGEKAADAARKVVGSDYVVCTWSGGSNAVEMTDWSSLSNCKVCVWPDADESGFKAALKIVKMVESVAGAVSGIVLPDVSWPKGADLADFPEWDKRILATEIRARLKSVDEFEQAYQERYLAEEMVPVPIARHDYPYALEEDGVWLLQEGEDGDYQHTWICSYLSVLAKTRDEDNVNWGLQIEVVDPDGVRHRWAIPMSMFSGNGDTYRSRLLEMGLRIGAGRAVCQHLHSYLSLSQPPGRLLCVSQVGWYRGRFILPDSVYGQGSIEEDVVLQGANRENPFKVKGTLSEWRMNISRLCVGNSRLVLAVCIALAGVLLEPCDSESGGFHFVGGSSTGKTTTLRLGATVIGPPGSNGPIKQWRATSNALESIATMHCDSTLFLDEVGQASSEDAATTAYMLANGQGKARGRQDGSHRPTNTWRLLFLSTGEVTLADKIEEGKGQVKAGQAVRMVDVPIDAGVGLGGFENLHGCDSADAFARKLKRVSSEYYGRAFKAFIELIASDLDAYASEIRSCVDSYIESNSPPTADGQVHRVCARFGLVAAAGEAARQAGIVDWPEKEAINAAKTCFQAWLNERGGLQSCEILRGIEQVRAFYEKHGSSRFQDADEDGGPRVNNRAGYRRQGPDGKTWFCTFPSAFKEACSGFDQKMLGRELRERGFLLSDSKRQTKSVRINREKNNLYVITSDIFGVDGGDAGDK